MAEAGALCLAAEHPLYDGALGRVDLRAFVSALIIAAVTVLDVAVVAVFAASEDEAVSAAGVSTV